MLRWTWDTWTWDTWTWDTWTWDTWTWDTWTWDTWTWDTWTWDTWTWGTRSRRAIAATAANSPKRRTKGRHLGIACLATRARLLEAAILAVVALMVHAGISLAADTWPRGQIMKVVVPYAAGSNGDAVGRVTARYLNAALPDTTIIVENRPGTGGILGTRSFTKMEPDGFALCVCSSGAITVPSIVEKGYAPLKDLAPISQISASPLVLIVNSKTPIRSVQELVAWSKQKAGGLSYGSSGAGGLMYNAAEVFRNKTGAIITHVPFRGGPDASTALIAGEIDLVFSIMSDALSRIDGKSVRPIAVTTPERTPLLPDVPTMIEEGVPAYDVTLWNGLFAPARTPKTILDQLSAIMVRMSGDQATRQAMVRLGTVPSVNTPDQFREELRAETSRWESYLSGIKRE